MVNQGTSVPHGKLGLRDILGVRPGDDLIADKRCPANQRPGPALRASDAKRDALRIMVCAV